MSRDTRRTTLRLGTAITAALLTALGLAAPAVGGTVTTPDRRGDVAHRMDLQQVKVRHARAVTLTLRHRDLRDGGWSGAFLDLRGGRGPELLVVGGVGTHYDLYRARGWQAGARVRCDYDSTLDRRADTVRYVISRGCLERVAAGAKRVRVSAFGGVDGARQDWAPGRRAYGAWVRRG